jgi:hypothetical protein
MPVNKMWRALLVAGILCGMIMSAPAIASPACVVAKHNETMIKMIAKNNPMPPRKAGPDGKKVAVMTEAEWQTALVKAQADAHAVVLACSSQ